MAESINACILECLAVSLSMSKQELHINNPNYKSSLIRQTYFLKILFTVKHIKIRIHLSKDFLNPSLSKPNKRKGTDLCVCLSYTLCQRSQLRNTKIRWSLYQATVHRTISQSIFLVHLEVHSPKMSFPPPNSQSEKLLLQLLSCERIWPALSRSKWLSKILVFY